MADVGRPLKFASVEELEQKIAAYFDSCYNADGALAKPFTITGLALYLDTTRRTLLDYEKRDDEYSHTIKRAKLRIENFAEESLFTSKQTAGIIFNLINNYDWSNKQDVAVNGSMHNTTQDVSSLTPEERRARIDELERRRRIGTDPTTGG